jgi:pyruvate,water dikinase
LHFAILIFHYVLKIPQNYEQMQGGSMGTEKLIFWFDETGKEHNDTVGKKCANLGEMTRMGLPVPPGFAISIYTYKKFIQDTGAGEKISMYVSNLGELKGEGIALYEDVSRTIRTMIEGQPIPETLRAEILTCYEELCNKVDICDVPVSVRSAGTASRPGMFETEGMGKCFHYASYCLQGKQGNTG